MPASHPIRRALVGLTATAVTVAGALSAPAVAADDPNPRSRAAADWLAAELDRQNPWRQGDFVQYGATLDALFSLQELGIKPRVRRAVLDAIEPETDSYVSFQGQDFAGSMGKLLTAVVTEGRSVGDFADGDLVTRLEALVDTDGGADNGYAPSAFNVIGQAWVVRALSAAGSDLADETTRFLMQQFCPGGFFREGVDADFACDSADADAASQASVDTTALAVLALLQARRNGSFDAGLINDVLDSAEQWLISQQYFNGGFDGAAGRNANSTGLAGLALQRLGARGPAGMAAAWLATRQVTTKVARESAIRVRDIGAIAPTPRAMRVARREDGITAAVRINWRLATAQAAATLDALLPARRLRIDAPDNPRVGTNGRFTVSGLAPGEFYEVRLDGDLMTAGLVSEKPQRFQVGLNDKGRHVVKVTGSRDVRAGRVVITVR